MSLTDEGYTALRTADFLTLIRDELELQLGVSIDFDHDVVFEQFTAVLDLKFAAGILEVPEPAGAGELSGGAGLRRDEAAAAAQAGGDTWGR